MLRCGGECPPALGNMTKPPKAGPVGNYNYGLFGRTINSDLINSPDLLDTDPTISFQSTIWFWMTPQGNKPSSHDVITGRWSPSAANRTLNVVTKHAEMHMKLKKKSGKKMATYNLNGFVWALKIWILESYPNNMFWWTKEPDIIPHAPIVKEESVDIDDKSGGIDVHDPVAATESNQLLEDVDSPFKEIIDVIPALVGRVDELRTKLVQTLTPNVIPKETKTSKLPLFNDSRKPNNSKGDQNNYYYQKSQPGSLQHLLNALEPKLPPDVACLRLDNVDEPHFDTTVKDNTEMKDNIDVDNKDGKYCLDDMSIGFEEDSSNGEINANLDRFIAHVMHTENMYVAIESHSFEPYQIMNMSEENLVKYNDRASLKTGFCVVGRKKKSGVALQSPYEQQQSTTPPLAKRRTVRSQILESLEFPSESEVNGEEQEKLESIKFFDELIAPFSKDLRRHKKCNLNKVTVPCYIKMLLKKKRSGEPTQLFKFSWDPYGIVVDDRFWLALLGLEDKKDDELWVELLRSFRAPDADWAIAGPHFCPAILGGGMPIYHANAKKGRVPWTEVEKVYFPLNELEVHWALAELHIRTVTFVLDKIGVLKRKELLVGEYKITYQFKEKVPHQVVVYGDCGV
nr:hypothetical protein [Tanacetum cinerariifolium]